MADRRPVLAIDIGGTKLAAAVTERDGRVIVSVQDPTPRDPDPEILWRSLCLLLGRVLAEAGLREVGSLSGVGAGCGGPMEWPSGVVSPLNIPAWRAFPLRDRLRELFPGTPVRVHNDAICLVAGEHNRGAARGRGNVLGMVAGTGVGGGLILDSRIISGASGNAGHIGHVVVDPAGPECACGGHGCLEAIARGPALVAWAQGHGWRLGDPDATARDLAEDASYGNEVGLAAFRRAGRALGIAIASATHLCDLEMAVVGGGLAQAGRLLFEPLREALRFHARMEFARRVEVVPAELGPSAFLVGAAALIFAGDRYWAAD
ncbi:MAG TPA: ROK family protein [Streptosporangiaceae bacterium]|nr:ROK family protein [Streptosporangiaceae bacterium]